MTRTSPALSSQAANIKHGEVIGSITAAQLPDIIVGSYAKIKAPASNTGVVAIGSSSSVTLPAGSTTTTAGYPLSAGEETEVYVENLNLLYMISTTAADDLSYIIYD